MQMFRKAGFYLRLAAGWITQDSSNLEMLRDVHFCSFIYYYMTPLLPKLAPHLAEYYQKAGTVSAPYFQNKDVRVWPKVQLAVLLEMVTVSYDNPVLYTYCLDAEL